MLNELSQVSYTTNESYTNEITLITYLTSFFDHFYLSDILLNYFYLSDNLSNYFYSKYLSNPNLSLPKRVTSLLCPSPRQITKTKQLFAYKC